MLPTALCWFLGALLLIAGVLASLYLGWVQIRRGVSTFSLLATSDALATIGISVIFLVNAAQGQKSESRISMEPSQCNKGQLTLVSALFLAPFINTFVSMMAHSAENLQTAQSRVEVRGREARKNPRLVSSVAAQWILPSISTLLLFSAGIQHSRTYRSDPSDTCMEGTALTPIPVESTEQCLHQEDISDYITTLMNNHNFTSKHLPINKTQSTDEEVAQVVNNIYKILQINRTRRSRPDKRKQIHVNFHNDKSNRTNNMPTQRKLLIQRTQLTSILKNNHKSDNFLKNVHRFNKWEEKTPELEKETKKITYIHGPVLQTLSPMQNEHYNETYAEFYKGKNKTLLELQDKNNYNNKIHPKLQAEFRKQPSPLISRLHIKTYNSAPENYDKNNITSKQIHLKKLISNNLEFKGSSLLKNKHKNKNDYTTIQEYTHEEKQSLSGPDYIHRNLPKQSSQQLSLLISGTHEHVNCKDKTTLSQYDVNQNFELHRKQRSPQLENTPGDGDYYDTTDEYYDNREEESTPSELEDQNNPLLETSKSPLQTPETSTETPKPSTGTLNPSSDTTEYLQTLNTPKPEATSPAEPDASQDPPTSTEPESAALLTEIPQTEMTTHKQIETGLIEIQIPDTFNMCIVKCYLSNTFLKKYLFVLLFLCYFIPIIASITMYFSTPNAQSIVEVKPSTAEESCSMQSSTTPTSATTVKHSIISSVIMWSPTLVETLLRAWFCVSTPQWLTMLLFVLAQTHAIIRNSINLRLVRKQACSGTVQPLTQGEDMPAKLFTKVKAAILN